MTQTILALDLGTTTGWASSSPDGSFYSGTWDFKPKRFEGGGMRYLRFRSALEEFVKANGSIARVAFEEVRRHQGVDAAHVYGGLMATLTAWCEHHSIPYEGIPVGTIKKFGCGRGNAGKQEMIDAAVAAGFHPKDDNEADAIHLLRYVLSGGP